MSFTTGTCPHNRDVFAWLAYGPAEDGTYPWAHLAPASPGHLEVCGLMPSAAAAEAANACECGHDGGLHSLSVRDSLTRTMPCQACDCQDLCDQPGDLEAWHAAEARRRRSTPPAAVSTPEPAEPEQLSLWEGAA